MTISGKFTLGHRRSAKLKPGQVLEIRRLYSEENWTQGRLAREFGMSVGQIGRIVRGEQWQDYHQIPTDQEVDSLEIAEIIKQPLTAEEDSKARRVMEKLLAADAPASTPQGQRSAADLLIKPCACGLIKAPRHKFPRTVEGTIHCLDKPCYQEEIPHAADPT